MGRLVGLELYNFKSYKGITHVGFGTSYFTSIIGPNGSGKSNMMDAISFVLGVRSNQLRSKNIKSLIYRGQIDEETETTRNDENGDDYDDDHDYDHEDKDVRNEAKARNGAEEAYVIAVYEKDNGDVLNLKRLIGKNGSSKFLVNNVPVSINQYLQILKEENILIKAKNFLVFQGDVEKVASQSPIELTKMIENISGSSNLEKEYNELKEEMERAHDITALKNSQKRNLKDEIKNLKLKCQETDLFDKKTSQLERAIVTKYLSKLEYMERIYEKLTGELDVKNKEVSDLSTTLEDKIQEYKDFIRKQSDDHMSIKEYEVKIETDENTLKSLKTSMIPIESEALQLEGKVKEYEERMEILQREEQEQKLVVDESIQILDKIKAAFEVFNSEKVDLSKNESTSSYSSNIEMLTEYNQLRDEFLAIAGELELKLTDLNEDKAHLLNEVEAIETSNSLLNSRIQELETKKQTHQLKKSQLEKAIAYSKTSIHNYKKELNSLESLRNSIKEKEKALNHELKTVLLKLNEINALEKENKKERKLRDTVSTLKKLFPGVRGLLNDICKPKQRKYGIAVAAIFGKDFDAVIVDSLSTATECIDYMKEQRLGVASFIPLDTVKVQPLNSNLRDLSDNAQPIIDTISYPPEYERAVQYVCGNSLVCDNIDVATSLKWGKGINERIVTLDGSLIHKNGLMTGGGSDSFNTKWDKSELGLLSERKDELKLKISEIHHQIPDDMKDRVIKEEILMLENNIEEYVKKLNNLERNLKDADVELIHELDLKKKNESQITEIKSDIKLINDEISDKSKNLKKSQARVYKDFCLKYKFVDIEEYEVNYSSKIIKEANESSKYIKEIQRVENKLKFETERLDDYKHQVEKLKATRDSFYTGYQNIIKERNELETKIDDIQSELEVIKEDYKALKSKVKKMLSKTSGLETEISNLKSDLKHSKGEVVSIEENIESLKLEMKTQLITAKLESVPIPLIAGSLDDIPLEDSSKDQEEWSKEWVSILSNLEIDYSKLEDDYRVFIEGEDMDEGYEENTPEAVEKRCDSLIEKLQEEVRNMHPDIFAGEHLATALEKLQEVDSEFVEARTAEKELVTRFEKVREERTGMFMRAFEHVSNSIDDVYKELTKSKASPLGGSAYLTLEDEDEPYAFGIKYHIMPPLKRFRDMENLSGGEKTIGALALLFAVHSYHPSPFFVLDEVDAALDNSNVNRIANYLSKHKGPNFQFIVISLKNSLFERSDALVGIYRDQDMNSSKILTLDLREYEEAA